MVGADLSTVFDGLNSLGRVPWRINKKVFEAAKKCWEMQEVLGDIPSQQDLDVPPMPVPPERIAEELYEDKDSPLYKERATEWKAYYLAKTKYKRMKQKNQVRSTKRFCEVVVVVVAPAARDVLEMYTVPRLVGCPRSWDSLSTLLSRTHS